MSSSLWPHGLQHTRLPCPSLSPRVCSNSCPLSWWCHPTISSSVALGISQASIFKEGRLVKSSGMPGKDKLQLQCSSYLWHPTPVLLPGRRSLEGCSPWGRWGSDMTERLHFPALEKEMAAHSSVLAWRISGTGEPGGLPSMGSHRVRHDWSDLAAAAVTSGAGR